MRKFNSKSNTPKQQLDTIKDLCNRQDVNQIILATDYDREGQLIGELILNSIQTSKSVYRILLNEWTEQAIKQQLQNLIPNSQMHSLYQAGLIRQHMDWILGINLTVTSTLMYNKSNKRNTFKVGRVLLPTLNIIYNRYLEQKAFIPVDYALIDVILTDSNNNQYKTSYGENNNNTFTRDYAIQKRFDLQQSYSAEVTECNTKIEEEYSKPLFNLTRLQERITTISNLTSDKVLSICQSLYEKQLITYPRTDSCYLDESMIGRTKALVEGMKLCDIFEDYKDIIQFKGGKTIFDNSKVNSHGAIIPTSKQPTDLTEHESLVYIEILYRFISKFMPNCKKEVYELKLQTQTGGVLTMSTSTPIDLGWKVLYQNTSNTSSNNNNYQFSIGDKLIIHDVKLDKRTTEPPNDHTEASLLRIMENCGNNSNDINVLKGYSIGTPATRADIIKKLKMAGYINNSGKYLRITEKGKYIVDIFPYKHLLDLDFTGRLEKRLSDIQNGTYTYNQLKQEIDTLTIDTVNLIKSSLGRKMLGTCPICGNIVVDGKRGYGCLNYINGCTFMLLTNDQYLTSVGVNLDDQYMSMILNRQPIQVGFYNQAGNVDYYNLTLVYENNQLRWNLNAI